MDNTSQPRRDLFIARAYLWICLLILPFGFIFSYWVGGRLDSPTQLFGAKTQAPFDFWTLQHLINGIVFARAHRFFQEDLENTVWRKGDCLWTILFLAFVWEGFEAGAETGMWGTEIAQWFWGLEHWTNRVITDPLLLGIGGLIYIIYPRSLKPALVIATLWLMMNLIMPDSMALQHFILTLFA